MPATSAVIPFLLIILKGAYALLAFTFIKEATIEDIARLVVYVDGEEVALRLAD